MSFCQAGVGVGGRGGGELLLLAKLFAYRNQCFARKIKNENSPTHGQLFARKAKLRKKKKNDRPKKGEVEKKKKRKTQREISTPPRSTAFELQPTPPLNP